MKTQPQVRRSRDKTALRRNAVPKTTIVKNDSFGVKELFCGNALFKLETYPDNYFDVCIADFPYGVGMDYGETYTDSVENLEFLIENLLPLILRVSQRAAIFTGVENMTLYPKPTWTLCWHIPGSVGSCKWGFPCWQPILVYGKDPYMSNGLGRRPDFFSQAGGAAEHSVHPCPKPLKVLKRVVERVSLPGEHVLDPVAGSGVTGMACMLTGRSFTGIEINPTYFEEMQRNVEAAQLQILNRNLIMGDAGYKRQMDFIPMGKGI